MPDARQQLLAALVEQSYRWDPVKKFRLASGRLSDYYLECKLTTFQAHSLPLVGQLLYDRLKGRAVACGGLTQGADPLALAWPTTAPGRPIRSRPSASVKNPKPTGRGAGSRVAPSLATGSLCLTTW